MIRVTIELLKQAADKKGWEVDESQSDPNSKPRMISFKSGGTKWNRFRIYSDTDEIQFKDSINSKGSEDYGPTRKQKVLKMIADALNIRPDNHESK